MSAKATSGSAEKTICHNCWGTKVATVLQARWKAVTKLLLLRPSVSTAAASHVLQVRRHSRRPLWQHSTGRDGSKGMVPDGQLGGCCVKCTSQEHPLSAL